MNQIDMSNQARIERTRHELTLLSESVVKWLARRTGDDRDDNDEYLGQHETQLETIGSVLRESLAFLDMKLKALSPARASGEVYGECRDVDETIVWVQRIWEYFKEKFDQRDEAQRTGPLLKAADEVVWSCYRQVSVQLVGRDAGVQKRPPPLAFIEPQYSPAAVESDRPLPLDLRLSAEVPFVSEFIKTLPVAVVSLPPWCIDAPWWLIYLGHEVGHHILHDLNLTAHFRAGMQAAAAEKKLPADDVQAWGRWAEEIFADVFSVLMLGEWAVWSVAEAERGTTEEMVRRKDRYPSPIIRLALLAQTAQAVGIDYTAALAGVDAQALLKADATSQVESGVVPGAVKFALGPLREGMETLTLPELCGLGKGAAVRQALRSTSQRVGSWLEHLRGVRVIPPQRNLETAREVISASLRGWKEMSAAPAPADSRAAFAQMTRKTLRENAPKGVRAGGPKAVVGKGEELVRRLLNMSQQRRAQGG
jgi:hypothetical protein